MPDNIYPDLTNSQYDIKYAKRKILASDLKNFGKANQIVTETRIIETEDNDPDLVPGIDSVLAVGQWLTANRNIEAAGFNLEITSSGNDIINIITSSGQINYGQYGIGTFAAAPAYMLAVDAVGNMIEVDPASLFGSDDITETDPTVHQRIKDIPVSDDPTEDLYLHWDEVNNAYERKQISYNELTDLPFIPGSDDFTVIRFGVATEDDTAGEHRSFNLNGYTFAFTSGRFSVAMGANVAAANDLVLGNDGNLFTITGNTQINAIATANWQAGSEIAFIFTGTPTLKHNTAGGGGTATMKLAGASDFIAAAGDYLGLRYDGTNWYETNRRLAAIAGSRFGKTGEDTTADADRTFNLGADHRLFINGSRLSLPIFEVNNSNTGSSGAIRGIVAGSGTGVVGTSVSGSGVNGTSTSSNGVWGSSSSGFGVHGTSTSNIGVHGQSNSSYGVRAYRFGAGTNDRVGVLQIMRFSSGSTDNGFGANIDFTIENSDGAGWVSARIGSHWMNHISAEKLGAVRITTIDKVQEIILTEYVGVQASTNTNTPTVLNPILIPDESCGSIEVSVVARHSTTSGMIVGRKVFSYVKDGGVLTLGTPVSVLPDEITGSLVGASYAISVGSNQLNITVTGLASVSINWKATVKIIPSF